MQCVVNAIWITMVFSMLLVIYTDCSERIMGRTYLIKIIRGQSTKICGITGIQRKRKMKK